MIGYEILHGNYGLNNFTQGTALWLQPKPSLLGCDAVAFPPDSYTYKPFSAASVITGTHISAANIVSGTHVGFWTDPQSSNGTAIYHPFVPGTYTVVAGDEWGQIAMLHFTVQG